MALHILIKTDRESDIHADLIRNDYTLCGMETQRDIGIGYEGGKYTKKKINCPHCIRIIKYCKNIDESEY